MPSSLSGFLPFSVMPVRILLCWVFSVMDFSMCDCWASVQTDNSTKAQKHFLSWLTLQHWELLLMIYPKLQAWAGWHQTFSSFCQFCVLRVFCVHPTTDGSYSSVQQSSSVVRHLLKTHQWPTSMHWVTRSFMTGNMGTAVYFESIHNPAAINAQVLAKAVLIPCWKWSWTNEVFTLV